MAEANKKKSFELWRKGLKAEFSKIIWPTKASIIRQSVVVVIITAILGVLIGMIDQLIQFGLDKLIG
jgi:preprotein translocase subunit SecE